MIAFEGWARVGKRGLNSAQVGQQDFSQMVYLGEPWPTEGLGSTRAGTSAMTAVCEEACLQVVLQSE